MFNDVMTVNDILNDLDLDANPLAIEDSVADLLFRDARTVNTFSDEEVTDAQVQSAYELLRWGPTAMNTTPLRLLLVRSPEARVRLAAHMNEGNRERVLAAPLTIVAAADADFHEHLGTLLPHMPGARDMFAGDAEARAGMSRTSALIQVGYLVVALRAVGLHVGPMGGMDAAAIDADLLGDTSWRSLLVINVGQPSGPEASHPRAPRLEYAAVSRSV